ncbi:EF hand family protein [Salpingoeca rosetta]|uniref:EF hand family protein n=1 Tax=Salpingoeca rosetta (strain ATCC 50818 / BSB-021) TaxID=946362 RepID=F2U812_SALR5|nr:EF hand family protein [Salpingoeca rosetta]EGD72917.1 EF hand family protein [Salpingoeca rosetta]|eukprot:XP_004994739.1 EF hand family protein [Salpingoeca rosetta]
MAFTQRGESTLKRDAKLKADQATDPIEKLRYRCLERGAGGISGLGRIFRIMDDNGNKKLDFDEFKKGLHDFGVHLDDEEEYHDCFDRFDANGDGNVDFEEFLQALRPPMSSRRKKLIRQAFSLFDKNNDGNITAEDLEQVYRVDNHPKYMNGEWTKEQCLNEFLKTFEQKGVVDGVVTYEEFLNYYAGVSASVDDDAYFDLMMRQAWKF